MRNERSLTTGQVAEYCSVSRTAVVRWIHDGKLKAHTTPGGHHRIARSDFRAFLARFDLPVDAGFFGDESPTVLVIANDARALASIVEVLSGQAKGCVIDVALDVPTAIRKLGAAPPELVILDSAVQGVDSRDMWSLVVEGREGHPAAVLVLTGEEDGPPTELMTAGCGRLPEVRRASIRRRRLDGDALPTIVTQLLAS